LFEVKIAIGSSNNIYEAIQTVHTGEECKIYLDIAEFSKVYMAEYIRFSVRPMSDVSGKYNLYISSIEGISLEYDDNELVTQITNERMRIRNKLDSDDDNSDKNTDIIVVVSVVSVSLVLGIMLFIFLKRDEYE
jgi:hypothetical protein